jgi:NifU-like protein involved in Fe-S cluster formation
MDYSAEVQRRFVTPRYGGALDSAARGVLCGQAEDRALNVWIRFQVQVREGVVEAARFQAYGCPHTVAAASWAAERLQGQPADSLRQWSAREAAAALQVPVEKLGKLLRLEDAIVQCWRALGEAGDRGDPARGNELD